MSEQPDPVKYIEAKLLPNPLSETLIPVLIFQYDGGQLSAGANGLQKVFSYLSGSGTMVRLSNGRYCIMTTEHLFSVHHPHNRTCHNFIVRVLREKEDVITRDLISASPFFAGRPGLVDLAVCEVSETGRTQKIVPFSQYHCGDSGIEGGKETFNICEGNPEDLTIRSLVSGESAKLLCMKEVPNTNGLRYYVVDCDSIPGESGTGFVDNH